MLLPTMQRTIVMLTSSEACAKIQIIFTISKLFANFFVLHLKKNALEASCNKKNDFCFVLCSLIRIFAIELT